MSFVTTCSLDGWNEYGKKFVESFIKYFPEDTILYIYVDFKTGIKHPRVIVRNIENCDGLSQFQEKIKNMPFATGKRVVSDMHSTAHSPHIIWNARKFSFKVFSVEHAVLSASEDVVTWIDADSIAFQTIPKEMIEDLIPCYCMVSYLGRNKKYSECGYVSYNRQNPLTALFVTIFADLFRNGEVFSLKEWHDSYIFDVVRTYFEIHYGVENFNISYDVRYADHVFINSAIGDYIDHLKGGRKEKGQSDISDLLRPNKQPYWRSAG
jgi:hypothetical protein